MKRKKIKKSVVLVVLIIFFVIGFFIIKGFNDNSIKNNSYIKTIKNIKLYNKNKKVVGSIDKNIIIKISNKENNLYKLIDSNLFIENKNIKVVNKKEEKDSSYIIPLNKNIKTNKKVILTNENKKVIINNGIETKINSIDNDNYYILYLGNYFSIKKDKSIKEINHKNSKYNNAKSIPVINYNEITDKDCVSCVKESTYLEHLKYLKDNGYYTISMDDYIKYIKGYISVKDKAILLTTKEDSDEIKKLNKNNKLKIQVPLKELNFINSARTPNKDINKLNRYNIKSSTSIETFKKMVNKENVIDPYPFKKENNEQSIPVLNYHFFYDESAGESCNENICLDTKMFEKHLKYLKDNGYKTLTMEEFTEWMYGDLELPDKSVLLTIDDGAMGTGKHNGNKLIPLLEKYDEYATLYLITGWWDVENYRSKNLDINSHTHDMHKRGTCGKGQVVCATEKELFNDLSMSLTIVDNNNSFCFPFYQYSEESLKTVEKAGFKLSFIGGNVNAKRSDNKYMVPRYPIHKSHSFEDFVEMVN